MENTQRNIPDELTACIDTSISPAEDFYGHVNRKWCDANPIPPKEGRWGAFTVLSEEAKENLKAILEELAHTANLPDGSNAQKLRDLYLIGMNEERIEREWLAPVEYTLRSIQGIRSVGEVIFIIAHLHRMGCAPLWCATAFPDIKKSDINRLYFEQAGLSLPDRDYYVKEDEKFAEIRKAFLAYIESVHRLLGDAPDEAARNARTILALETRLALASRTATERRDDEKQYHPMTLAELSLHAPDIRWQAYLESLGVSKEPTRLIIRQPEFIKECSEIFREAEMNADALRILKTYLRWHFIDGIAKKLPRAFAELQFGFYGRTLSGIEVERPRWEWVLSAINEVLGEALGELYVARHFPAEAKTRIGELVDDLQEVFRERIARLPWMSEATKQRAFAKLATFKRKLGYPEKWRDYARFRVSARDSYAENYLRGCVVEFERQMRKIDKEVDRTEWHMTPQTVNAYCDQQQNEIAFPAAILQPPFFCDDADAAANYGAIGSVIGHELTHGFDDQGCKYDENGNLAEWWNAEDKKRFAERAAVLVKQFNACAEFGLSVNGELTLGENIADLGGLVIAYEALQRALARKGRPEKIGGFTPEQRFFLAYARTCRENIREELARQYITMDPHSPELFRVNVPLSNMPEFHQAFECAEGCKMHRPESERAEIW